MSINKTKLAMTGALVAGVAALTGVGSLALFTDSQDVGANAFAAGTVNISTNVTSDLVSFSDMMPGDVVTDSIVVSNGLNDESYRYAISSVATDDASHLKDKLVMTVKTIDVATPNTPCNDFDGTSLYTGDLDSSAGLIVGSAATGSQDGDRTLAQNTSETLCFRVSLPIGADNAYQGATTSATFSFAAEQTKNN